MWSEKLYILLIIATAIAAFAALIQGLNAYINIKDYFIQKNQHQLGVKFPKAMLLITCIFVIISLGIGYVTATFTANGSSSQSTPAQVPTTTLKSTNSPAPLSSAVSSIGSTTPSPTNTSIPTTIPTSNDPNLLYIAHFDDPSSWTSVGFQFNPSDGSIACGSDQSFSGSPTTYVPPSPDYKVVVTAQYLSGSNHLQISGRINPNTGQHISLGYNEPYLWGNNQFSLDNISIDDTAQFTLSATFKGPQVTILLHQGGINAHVTYSTSESLNTGSASIIATNTGLKIYSFEIFKV